MTHTEIEAFFAICRHRNISKAAAELFISQSALSSQLKALEADVGCPLLLRAKGKREIALTAQGQAFYDLALQYRDIVQKMSTLGRNVPVTQLRVSAIESVGTYLLPPALERFLAEHPNIRLSVQEMEADAACLSIIGGKTDLAFSTAKVETEQIVATPFLSDPFTVICGADAPYPSQVTLAELPPWDEVYVRWSADYDFWHQSTFGPETLAQVQLDIMGQIERFVAQPGRWAIVPGSVANCLCTNAALRRCTPRFPIPARLLYVLRHRDNAEALHIRRFLDTLHTVLEEAQVEGLLL